MNTGAALAPLSRLPGGRASPGRRVLLTALAPFLGLLVVIALFYAIPPHPWVSLLDLQTVAVHTVIVGIAAMGMTFIIISGGIDLSVGSAIALTSVAVALALKQGWGVPAAVVVALGTGALCGFYNSVLITLLRLPPFIATLGTLGFYRGLAKWISGSMPVSAPAQGLGLWVRPAPVQEWLPLAPAVWLMLALGVFLAAVLRYTILGRYTFAIGSNEATARLCGIRVPRMKVYIYVLAGLLTGLAGLMQFARLTQGDPTVAIGVELDVIAAVVIGGGSLSGGQGSMLGTLAGAFLMAFLRNRCTVLGWPNFVQEMIVGHIIIIAVAIDQWRARRVER
ncbi:MAG TPA: ABC transporter permease [Phycisphaerae bacterium]|nr:ABC transporter permease [Phycisphaerae bacterium]HNU44268.1 ABC transporter permease [Phycisphaerae bacterium]